jgi:phage recombination protein Bet
MSKDLTTQQDNAALISVLQASVFPGAAPASIELAIGYCKAAGYDVMLKPVHIVPMWSKAAGGMRDVIMPGIGLYRIQAARTGQFAGMTEVEFGPEATFCGVVHPVWARCTVKRQLSNGLIAEFTAVEFWRENYAEKGGKEKDISPNAMWSKRAYGQISKCAQAQALRMAFPEIGAHPTFEEMDGKEFEEAPTTKPAQTITVTAEPELLPPCAPERFAELLPNWQKLIAEGTKTADAIIENLSKKYTLTDDQKRKIKGEKIEVAEVAE